MRLEHELTAIEVSEALNVALIYCGRDSGVYQVFRRLAFDRDRLQERVKELESHLALSIEMREGK